MANIDLSRYRRIVQMFWDPEPTNDVVVDKPIWCLGRVYRISSERVDDNRQDGQPSELQPRRPSSQPTFITEGGWPQAFLNDIASRFWMTYRYDFEPIPRSTDSRAATTLSLPMRIKSQLGEQVGFSSDKGWGCMIRSGQSLLANTIAMLQLGRGWHRGRLSYDQEGRLISLFADDTRAPYSIHNFVHHGAAACGKYPGQWFGPSATAQCIQALVNSYESPLRVYSTGDGPDIYEDSLMKIAKSNGSDFCPTLILVGTRLGIDKITPVYWEAILAALRMPQSVGIAGGRPSSSYYFVGVQSSFLFYLDPHHTQPALPYYADPSRYTAQDLDSCHTNRIRRLHIQEVDPSILIGFLIRSENDWLEWRKSMESFQGKAIIHVCDRNPASQVSFEATIYDVDTVSDEEAD